MIGATHEGIAGGVVAWVITVLLTMGGLILLSYGSNRPRGRRAGWFTGGLTLLILAVPALLVAFAISQCSGGATCFE